MTTKTVSMLNLLAPDQRTRSAELLKAELGNAGIGQREMSGALQRGLGMALYSGPPGGWGNATTDRAGHAAGRLLLRLAGELQIPLEGMVAPTAIGLAEELLS